jgi:hypothetical protein
MPEFVSSCEMQTVKTIHRLPATNIVIDYWKPSEVRIIKRKCLSSDAIAKKTFQFFFYQGSQVIRFMTVYRLTDNQLQNIKANDYKIYTSSLNKKLLECQEVSADRIIAIEPQSSMEIVDELAGYSFEVSIIDSNHCIGSCMFLFQGMRCGYFL